MANLLYEEQSVADIASAIRAKDGDDTLMKVGDMATRVRSLGYGYSGVVSYSDTGTQPATDVGKLVLLTGENFTLTMPNAASLQPGVALTYYNDGNGNVTLSGAFENGDTSFAVQKGMSISVVWSGNSWAVIDTQVSAAALDTEPLHRTINLAAGLAQFIADGQSEPVTDNKTPAEIATMLKTAVATEGDSFVRFNSGVTIQWGNNVSVEGTNFWGARTITFPVAFSEVAYCCVATIQSDVQMGRLMAYAGGLTLTGVTLTCARMDQAGTFNTLVQYIAIGK